MTPRSTLIYLLAVLLAAPAAHAQPQGSAAMWRTFAQNLPMGSLVRVRTRDGRSLEGHLVQASDDVVRLNLKTRIPVPIHEIAFADVDRIERRHDGWSPGAKVFLSVGIAAGAALIMFLAALSHFD
jgi:hypothetical protein